jgi:hypothetical protein
MKIQFNSIVMRKASHGSYNIHFDVEVDGTNHTGIVHSHDSFLYDDFRSPADERVWHNDPDAIVQQLVREHLLEKLAPSKPRRSAAPSADDIAAIRRALPYRGITEIVERTGYDFQICQRTLSGKIKIWDSRHSAIIREAKRIIKEVSI